MVVVFGSINVDLLFPLSELPQPGQTLLAAGASLEPGGKGANQACAAALDGAQVVMVGAVGSDALAEPALARLRAAGVDLSRVQSASGLTGCAAICTDRSGRNQIVVASGANLQTRAAVVEDALLGPGTVLVTQMEVDPAETATLIRRAGSLGARTVHNLAPALPLDPDVLRAVDVLVVNEDEAGWLAGTQGIHGTDAASLHGALGVAVVCTLGGRGVAWAGSGRTGQVPARAVDVVDTTAAGDCFVGVLAAALERGWALDEAVVRANVAAALSCTRAGSQRSLPDAREIDASTQAERPGRRG